jgi:hypothetical protein
VSSQRRDSVESFDPFAAATSTTTTSTSDGFDDDGFGDFATFG